MLFSNVPRFPELVPTNLLDRYLKKWPGRGRTVAFRKRSTVMYAVRQRDANGIERSFARMGARVGFGEPEPTPRWSNVVPPVALDVRSDNKGEYFLIRKRADVSVEVLEVKPGDRHLVLLARVPDASGDETKSRFLLGHDERHWFVAAIPESNPVSTVRAAKDALKPQEVIVRERGVRVRVRQRRVNRVRVRQGEWFFVPAPDLKINRNLIFKNEPLRRGAGKPHVCQELYREGGETVYVNGRYPNGLTQAQFARLKEKVRTQPGWRKMVRNPHVYVRGTVRHSDHKTIVLNGWHEVFVNTETRAIAMRNVAFLD